MTGAVNDQCATPRLAMTRAESLDVFSEIRFIQRPDSTKVELGLLMPRKYWLGKGLMEHICGKFWESSSKLLPLKKYQTEDFYDDPDWVDYPPGYRQRIGRCIRVLADRGVLPITLTNPGKNGPRVYVANFNQAADSASH